MGFDSDKYIELIDEIFREDGLLRQAGNVSYEFRKSQYEMAMSVARALCGREKLLVEAPTGVGKSFAYLIPAAVYSAQNSQKTIVVTDTNTLLGQLEKKDCNSIAELLQRLCGRIVNISTICGKSNYVCFSRYMAFYANEKNSLVSRIDGNPKKAARVLQDLNGFVVKSRHGRINEVPQNSSYDGIMKVWREICMSDEQLCSDCEIRKAGGCKYYKRVVPSVAAADVILTNHSLLLSDERIRFNDAMLGSDKAYSDTFVLPPCENLIIDEAHNLSRNCERSLELVFSLASFRIAFSKLVSGTSNMFMSVSKADPASFNMDDAGDCSEKARLILDYLKKFSSICEKEFALVKSDEFGHSSEKILDDHEFSDDFFQSATQLTAMTDEVVMLFRRIKKTEANGKLIDYVSGMMTEVDEGVRALRAIIGKNPIYGLRTYFSMKHYSYGRDSETMFKASPVFAGFFLKNLVYDHFGSIVWTSATLDAGDNFGYFGKFNGIADMSVSRQVLSPSFDYERNMLQLMVNGLFADKMSSGEQLKKMTKASASFIAGAIAGSGGGALVLFTSYSDLNAVFDASRDEIEKMGIDLMKQEPGVGTDKLAAQFRKNSNSVLFATSSFWEGVDFAGETLRLLIIYRIPFRNPSDVLYKAQKKMMAGSLFFEYEVPNATIRLKQGMGRLLRTKTDRGVVVFMDDRIEKKYSGKIFKAVNMGHMESVYPDEALDKIGSFFSSERGIVPDDFGNPFE